MQVIRAKNFSSIDKINIAHKYLLPELLETLNLKKTDVIFNKQIIEHIVTSYTYEGGVRKLKTILFNILKEINLRYLSGKQILNKKISFPLKITKKILIKDLLKNKPYFSIEKINIEPRIGLVNGLWANNYFMGGILKIESYFVPSSEPLRLELTGMQGDVMKESMKVAKTLSWNLISDNLKEDIFLRWKKFGNFGIHIHCPDGSTQKDGPSAGMAIVTSIISLLINEKVDNTIAMTGEVNLQGDVTKIGGLFQKINGAKQAGVKTILIPHQNKNDYNLILQNKNNIVLKDLNIIFVKNIKDALNIIFKNNIKFLN